jgi:hypothetical protein
MFVLMFEGLTGLVLTFAPFHAAIQYGVLLHTLIGVVTLIPISWYLAVHWRDYKHFSLSHVVLLGYVATIGLTVCVLSGVVVTVQGLFALRMSNVWRQIHLISTFVTPCFRIWDSCWSGSRGRTLVARHEDFSCAPSR